MTIRNKRVLHIVTDFPFLKEDKICNYGGLGLCVMQLVDGLIDNGYKVDILSRSEIGITKEIYEGNVYRTPYICLSNSRNWKITHALTLIPKLIHLMIRKDYDIIHVHNPPAALFAVPIAKLFGKKVIMTMHGPWSRVREKMRSFAEFVERCSMVYPDRITFDSMSLAEEYPTDKRTVPIMNAVNTEKFYKHDCNMCRRKFGIPIGAKAVLYSGRSVYGKNLKTISKLARKLTDVWFVVAGENIGKRSNVINLGVVSNDDMPLVYSACDALVLDSSAEGMSRAVLEAMSCGCAVFLSDIPANKEVLCYSDAGKVFRDLDDLECFIKTSTRSEMRRMGSAGRTTILREFSMDKRISSFLGLYNGVLENR